jgi:hypothetical protein
MITVTAILLIDDGLLENMGRLIVLGLSNQKTVELRSGYKVPEHYNSLNLGEALAIGPAMRLYHDWLHNGYPNAEIPPAPADTKYRFYTRMEYVEQELLNASDESMRAWLHAWGYDGVDELVDDQLYEKCLEAHRLHIDGYAQ